MAKTVLTATQQFELRQALQVATLDALLTSRRWQPGELVFQGGTSLHLAHGSPRFSEDLDFLVNSTLDLDAIGKTIEARLAGTPWLPPGTKISVTKAKDEHNPHAFNVVVGGPNVIGAVRVKVELWKTTEASMKPLGIQIVPLRLASGPAAGVLTHVPTADVEEIYADKVFAVGARPYVKPRDFFDLHYLLKRHPKLTLSEEALRVRLATYPNETPVAWLAKAQERRASLPSTVDAVRADLRNWLPSNWPLTVANAKEIVAVSVDALEGGIRIMHAIAAAGSGPATPTAQAAAPRRRKP